MQIEDCSSNINLYIKFSEIWYCVNIIHVYILQAQILLHFICVIRIYTLQKFHSVNISLYEIVFW